MTEEEIIEEIKKGTPFEGLKDIFLVEAEIRPKIANFPDQAIRPDVVLRLNFGGKRLTIYGEVKTQVTPKLLTQIAPWLARLKALNQTELYVLICPFLSPQSQQYCMQNNIDFIDLSGNVLLRVPGKILIQRLGQPNKYRERQLFRNPFGGASSRIVRVLLELPNQRWSVTEIEKELRRESERQKRDRAFQLSVSSISKTVQSLEEELLIRRDKLQILVPEPRQLLFHWAEKYRERYKWMRRSSWIVRNPFGFDVELSIKGLKSRFSNLDCVVTGTTAANLVAPFVDIYRIDVFILGNQFHPGLRLLNNEQSVGPEFMFINPYDVGVAMYSSEVRGVTIASPIQTYLDCYARGGRDAKQANYLLTNAIEKEWNKG